MTLFALEQADVTLFAMHLAMKPLQEMCRADQRDPRSRKLPRQVTPCPVEIREKMGPAWSSFSSRACSRVPLTLALPSGCICSQTAVLLWCGRPERWRNLYGVSSVASVMKLLGMAHRDRPLWHQGSMVVCNLDATEGGPAYFPFRENIHTQPQGEPAC